MPAVRVLAGASLVVVSMVALGAGSPQRDEPLLEPGTRIERALSGPEKHTFRVALAEGEYASISVEQLGVDVDVTVTDATGEMVGYFDFESRRQGTESFGIFSDSASEYRITVAARFAKGAAGKYRIVVHDLRRAADEDRLRFEAWRLSARATTPETSGKAPEALDLLGRALALAESAGTRDDRFIAFLLTRIGEIERTRGNANAEALLDRAVSLSETALGPDDPQTAYARARLGSYFMGIDDFVRAEPLLQAAVAGSERTLGAAHPRVAANIIPLALLHTVRRDFDKAIPLLEKALRIAEQTVDSKEFTYLALVNNLGDAYLQRGDYERAEPIVARALEAIGEAYGAEHIRVTNPLLNLGVIAREKGQYARSLEFLWRAYGIRNKVLGERHLQTASILISIGNVHHAQGEYRQGLEIFQRALDVLETAAGPYHSLTMMTLANMGRTAAAVGDTAAAVRHQTRVEQIIEKNIALNIAIGSERQKLAYFDATRERTWRTVSLHAHYAPDDDAAAALATGAILRRKGRVLDAMAASLVVLRQRLQPEDHALLDALKSTTSELAALTLNGPGRVAPAEYRKQLQAVEDKHQALEADIGRRSAAFRASAQPLTLESIRAAIPPAAALVEFILYKPFDAKARGQADEYGPARYAAYVIRRHGNVRRVDLGPAETIDRAVKTFREALRDPKRGDVNTIGRRLDAIVFEPLRPHTAGSERVLLSPDGALNLVPFEALVDADGRYVVERHAITYLTSGRDLLRMQVARGSRDAPLVVADPVFGAPTAAAGAERGQKSRVQRRSVTSARDLEGVYFAPLAGTAAEARVIQSLFPDATVLTRAEATKDALSHTGGPRILHLASHGFFLEDAGAIQNPLLRSGIALAGANVVPEKVSDRGILTALEAANLDLWGTQLVTLSACDTGVGEIRDGEGVYGLRRAFVLAGAESLVMSLWPVSDYITRKMMTTYYTGLSRGRGRADALREAQLQMLAQKGRAHPFYWASFIHAGDWTPLHATPR